MSNAKPDKLHWLAAAGIILYPLLILSPPHLFAHPPPGTAAVTANPVGSPNRQQKPPRRSKANDMAPDFTLKTIDGKTSVKLSDFRGKKPVALLFGSYT
jgi:hypothetical protein